MRTSYLFNKVNALNILSKFIMCLYTKRFGASGFLKRTAASELSDAVSATLHVSSLLVLSFPDFPPFVLSPFPFLLVGFFSFWNFESSHYSQFLTHRLFSIRSH